MTRIIFIDKNMFFNYIYSFFFSFFSLFYYNHIILREQRIERTRYCTHSTVYKRRRRTVTLYYCYFLLFLAHVKRHVHQHKDTRSIHKTKRDDISMYVLYNTQNTAGDKSFYPDIYSYHSTTFVFFSLC